jgi:hypothetical protein
MKRFLETVGSVFVGLILIVVIALITGILVMLLWNWLMPVIFGLPQINFWQSWGLMCLLGFLFPTSMFSSKSK